ncbi:unnamed protein product [Bursaphelenchus xylophilus]|uniref:(pine wood nematode) hypothetical protein n=1 Tax=Bursaphelenchus xylophilus TaxID=6326 RepID=A0A1I7RHZ0_BURXY|nr:unnamed protein product [Bursaphelenchus xylophilus]CAG9115277.1 unnamed protein product [Bursaphelenchus xylophilus]
MHVKAMSDPWKLNRDVWLQILDCLDDDMDALCNLASSHSFFYRLIGKDFRRICTQNLIYRLPGETWAKACACAYTRTWMDVVSPDYYKKRVNIVRGYNSELFGFFYTRFVVVVSLDFSKPFCRYVSVDFNIRRVALHGNGKYLVVFGFREICVFRVDTGRLILKRCREDFVFSCLSCVYYSNNTILYFPKMKTYRLQPKETVTFISGDGKNGRYVWYKTLSSRLFVLDTEDGQNYLVVDEAFAKYDCHINVLGDTHSLVIEDERRNDLRIFEIHSGQVLFKCKSRDGRLSWLELSDYVIQNTITGEIIFYNESRQKWTLSPDIVLALGEPHDYGAIALRSFSNGQKDMVVGDYQKSMYCDPLVKVFMLEVKKNSVNLKSMKCMVHSTHFFYELYTKLQKRRDFFDFKHKSADALMTETLSQAIRKMSRTGFKRSPKLNY